MYIRDLAVDCTIGTRADERLSTQPIVVNIELECDLRKAGKSDRLEDTVNYSGLRRNIVVMMKASKFYLIEKLADEIARICLRDRSVTAVTVTVDKPEALDDARSAAVRIRRTGKRQ
jgi:dihydroneopterin aldolase/D-erythro-7,8-dihydroneopterin triphosphate epimerase